MVSLLKEVCNSKNFIETPERLFFLATPVPASVRSRNDCAYDKDPLGSVFGLSILVLAFLECPGCLY